MLGLIQVEHQNTIYQIYDLQLEIKPSIPHSRLKCQNLIKYPSKAVPVKLPVKLYRVSSIGKQEYSTHFYVNRFYHHWQILKS